MANDIVIKVDHVSKDFILPHEKVTSVKGAFTGMFRRNQTKEMQHALKDINLEIKKGEFFGIVGRNGSGKSTLLKILAGIYQPTKGKVMVNGKLVPFIELGVGFNPELTGRENVYLNGAMLGFSKKEVDAIYNSIVTFAELEQFMDKKLKNYSSGMQVRLAFSMAIRADADVLLVDEVLAVGDADFQHKCYDYFSKLKREKKTVIFVSHDMGAVQRYCDRVALIEDSKIVTVDKASKVSVMYSRLFIQDEERETERQIIDAKLSPSGEERWGDGWGKWESVKVSRLNTNDNGEATGYEITAHGIAHKAMEYPIFGFSIKNADFLQLVGTNTVRRSEEIKPLAEGEAFKVSWKVPNIFNHGLHYVDCTIAHDQATLASDRWPEAANFTVSRIEDNPYPLYSDGIQFNITEVK